MNCHDSLYAQSHPRVNSRRWFLRECGVGLGKIAAATLLADAFSPWGRAVGISAAEALKPKQPHFTPKAKHVIHLFMAGAPSQLDLFDYKPELAKLEGKPLPPSVIGGQRYAFIRPDAAVMGPKFKFAKHGQSGAELSEMLPHLPTVGDFLPGFEASAFFGVGVPRNTPAEIVEKLNKEINAGLADPKLTAKIGELGGTVLPGSAADFRSLIALETEKWAKVVKFSGAKPD